MSTNENFNAKENIRLCAKRIAEGKSLEEIAAEIGVPKLMIENTARFIADIVDIMTPYLKDKPAELPEDDGPNFLAMGEPLREFVYGNFAGACVVDEWFSNRQNKAEIMFTEKSGTYTVAVWKEDK